MAAARGIFAVGARDRRLLMEAAALLALARIGLRILSFPALQRLLGVPATPREGCPACPAHVVPGTPADRIAWAVSAVARRLPGRTTCLAEALAGAALLRRRGHAPEIRFGVRGRGNRSRPLAAHAWVECDGRIVIGEVENQAEYPALSAIERS